jgi:hypothetical protein
LSEATSEYGLPSDEAEEMENDIKFLLSVIRKYNTNPMNIMSWREKTKTRRYRKKENVDEEGQI